MKEEEKLFRQICERCENHATNMYCEDMSTCPAYQLYLIARDKRKVVYKQNDWQTPPEPIPGII
jgi:hypothetical protein